MTRDELLEKITKVEALFLRTDSLGEMTAAHAALERLNTQLDKLAGEPQEYKFSMPDPWKRQLFLALVRRHQLAPYRLPRQRQTTVMVKVEKAFLDTILWPQYLELSKLLHSYLSEVTEDIITQGIHNDLSEATEQPQLPMG
ncbi:MAG: hypothetical protein OSA48_04850 [Akkermansiaceae bacterium]|nr:hypothetical protein [Akkermansiaceae bacterium]